MDPDETTAPEAALEEAAASAPEPAPVETPEGETLPAAETTAEQAPPPKTYADWKSALADADPEELLKDPRVAGRIGQVADKRARELTAQREDNAEAERLKNLRRVDPVAYAEEMDRRDAAGDARRAESTRQHEWAADISREINTWAQTGLSAETRQKLGDKTYADMTFAQGARAFVAEAIESEVGARLATERAKLERELEPSIRKKVLAELNGSPDERPEVTAGANQPGQRFNSNYEASVALQEGRITIDRYRQLATQNGWR